MITEIDLPDIPGVPLSDNNCDTTAPTVQIKRARHIETGVFDTLFTP
jgi:hypothetical protein